MKTWIVRCLSLTLLVGVVLYPLLYFNEEVLFSMGIRHRSFPSFVVHVDLKGSPPRVNYLLKLMSWLGSHDVSAVLLEYEEMFPFDQRIGELASPKGFSHNNIADIMLTAERTGMEVIPFIRTFTDLEYVHEKKIALVHSFEQPQQPNWNSCHRQKLSGAIIIEIIDQVLSLHPNSRYMYIGESVLSKKKTAAHCLNPGNASAMVDLYIRHLQFVVGHLTHHWPDISVLASADVLAYASLQQRHELSLLMEPVVLDTGTEWSDETAELLQAGARLFNRVWGASSFKGSKQPSANYVHLGHTTGNHNLWRQYLREVSRSKFGGLVLMGPSRFSHNAPLCELLPVALPSLVLAMSVTRQNFTLEIGHRAALRLGFNGFVYDRPFIEEGRLNFPGSNVFRVVSELEVTMTDNQERENIAIDGDFLHRISSSLDAVYGQHFASEWLKLKVTAWTNPSVHSQLQVYRDSGNVSVGSPKGHYKLAERGLLWLGPAECIH